MSRELARKLAVAFRHLVKKGSFPAYWKHISVPGKSSSSDVGDYRPKSITPVLSKVFENFGARKLNTS